VAPRPLPKQLQRKHSAPTPHQEQQQEGQAQEPANGQQQQQQQQQAAAQEQGQQEQKVVQQPHGLPLEFGFPNMEAFQFPMAQGFLPNAAAVWGATAMLPPAAQGWLASVRAAAEALMNGSEEQLGLLTGPMAPGAAAAGGAGALGGAQPLSPAAAAGAAKQQPAGRVRQRKPKYEMSEEDTEETEDMDVGQHHHGSGQQQQQQRDQQQGDWSMRRSGRQRKPKVFNPPPSSSSSEGEMQDEEAMTESEPEADTPAQRQARWRAKQQQRQPAPRASFGGDIGPGVAHKPFGSAAPRVYVPPHPGAPILASELLQANPPELVLLQQHQKKREDSDDLAALLSAVSGAPFASTNTRAPTTMPSPSSIEHARQAFDWALQLLLECEDPGWLAEEPTSVVVRSHTNKDGVLVTKTDLIKVRQAGRVHA
jgi:hypothetical protein